MYLLKADYKLRISIALLEMIINKIEGDENEILAMASKSAEDTVMSYTGHLYNIVPEFEKTGLNRNFQILNWCLDIALYLIYQRIVDYEVPQKVIKNYDDTLEILEKVANGKLSVNLPPLPLPDEDGNIPDTGSGLRRIGSLTPRNHKM